VGIDLADITSKLHNARLLGRLPATAPHLPVTLPMSRESLTAMLEVFPSVYLKPDNSCQGKGVMRVTRLRSGGLTLHTRDRIAAISCPSLSILWNAVQRHKMKRPYLVQEGIESMTLKGQPFDLRVHLMRLDGKWEAAGLVGRIAAPGRVATNAYSAGKSIDVRRLFLGELGWPPQEAERVEGRLLTLSLKTVRLISSVAPAWPEFGLDIG
jgi:hypothetical protein